MALLLYQQNLFIDELESLDNAIRYGYLGADTLHALMAYTQKAGAYDLLAIPDSVLVVCETASNLCNQVGLSQYSATMLAFPIMTFLECGDTAKARHYMNIYEKESGYFDANGEIEHGREVYYYTKGLYYLSIAQFDSAEFYFRKELVTGKDFNNQNAGSRGLALLFQQTHKPDSAAKYALYSYEMNDSVYAHKATEEVAKTKALYDYTRYEHEALQEKERADRERSKTIVILVLAFIVVSIIVILFWLLRKRHRAAYRRAINKLGEAQNTILHLREHEAILNSVIERQTEEHKATEELKSEMTILRASIKEREAEIEKQKAILDRFHQKEILTKENVDQKINQSDIYKHLRIIANQGQRLTDEDWSGLMQLVISQLPGFYHLMSSKERDLTRLEYQICILDRLGIEPSRMRYLLGISESYVSRMRGGLHKKIFDSPASGKEFSLAIRTVC